jgi:ribosomal protein L11 methyltransferase
MPYRIDVRFASDAAIERLIELGAIDVEREGHDVAALMPDSISPQNVAHALDVEGVSVSAAVGRDADSVWILRQRPVRIGRIRIVPSGHEADAGAVKLIDAPAFGTGLHPTTALCLEALDRIVETSMPPDVLDVGTGSGVLALAALHLGVACATGIDTDEDALCAAAENARVNGVAGRLRLARGGPETLGGVWPLVFANILAAPLIEMAPTLVRRVAHRGWVVLSGIPRSVESDVERAYRHLGMRRVDARSQAGWTVLILQASW